MNLVGPGRREGGNENGRNESSGTQNTSEDSRNRCCLTTGEATEVEPGKMEGKEDPVGMRTCVNSGFKSEKRKAGESLELKYDGQ